MRRRLCGLAATTVLCVGTLLSDTPPAEAVPLPEWPSSSPPRLLPDPEDLRASIARALGDIEEREQAEHARAVTEAQAAAARAVEEQTASSDVAKQEPPQVRASWVHAWITDEILWELRQCESTNRYDVNTGNGFRGAVQWLQATWNAAAARADRPDLIGLPPNLAAPADQDYLTKVWWSVSDYRGQWPVCGPLAVRRAG